MKQELKKKKKAEKQADPTVVPPVTEPSSESEESDVETKKKIQKKKCPGKNGNWSSGSEEQEEPEEEDEEPPHYETDPGSPLFKSDHEFSPESDIEDESQVVPMKRARTPVKSAINLIIQNRFYYVIIVTKVIIAPVFPRFCFTFQKVTGIVHPVNRNN